MVPRRVMQAKKNPSALNLVFFAALALLLAGCTPPGPRALLEGKALLERGQFQKAVEKLTLATSLMATNDQAWNYLGLACHQAGDPTGAAKAYRRALDLNRELVEAHYNLGCLWLDQNKPEAAKFEFTACTLRRANFVEAWLKLGTAQMKLGESAAAGESFQKALRASPNHPEALNGLGLVSAQRRRPREAAQYFEAALKQQPDYRPALLNLATVLHRDLNDSGAAAQKYRAYLALTPRAADWDAVNAVLQSLEPKTAPVVVPRPPVTNPPPQITAKSNEPKPQLSVTNPPQVALKPAESKPLATNPPASVKSNATPALTQPATTTTTTPPTVVKLPPEPIIRAAPSVTESSRPAARPATPPKVVAEPTPEAAPKTQPVEAVGESQQKPEKRGFFSRLNPFRRDPKPAPKATPLPSSPPANGSTTKATALPPATIITEPTRETTTLTQAPAASEPGAVSPAPETAAPAPRLLPRYKYLAPTPASPGNREEAEGAFARGTKAQAANKWTEAAQAFQQATQSDGSYFEAYYNLGLAQYRLRDFSRALATWERALAIRPDSTEGRYMFALTLSAAGYFPDAAQEAEKILAANPNYTGAHLLLGNLCAEQLRDKARARLHYQRVLELDSRHPSANQIRYWLVANPA